MAPFENGQPEKGGQLKIFTDEKLCCCALKVNLIQDDNGPRVGVFKLNKPGSNQFDWNLTNPGPKKGTTLTPGQTAAHEVGHFLGNIEEYGESKNGHLKGRPRVSYGQGSGKEENSVMGENVSKGVAHERHFWRVMQHINGRADLKGCVLKKSLINMKSLIYSLVALILSAQLNAIPSPKQQFPEISGIILNGVWRKGFEIHRLHLSEKHEKNVDPSIEELPDHWILVLENVQGLSEDQLLEMNESFQMRGPSEPLSKSAEKPGRLLIWISGGKELKFKLGSKIKLLDLEYQSDERGGSFSYKEIKIE